MASSNTTALVAGALAAALASLAATPADAADFTAAQKKIQAEHTAQVKAGKVEPCFGTALKGKNDCYAGAGTSCAGTTSMNSPNSAGRKCHPDLKCRINSRDLYWVRMKMRALPARTKRKQGVAFRKKFRIGPTNHTICSQGKTDMLSVFCAPSRYTQGPDATAMLGHEIVNLGLSGPALIVAVPEKVSAVVKVRVPEPDWVRPPEPEIKPPKTISSLRSNPMVAPPTWTLPTIEPEVAPLPI